MQALDDFLAGALVRRGGQRQARHLGEEFGELPQLQVFGAEIVAPLRHAMRLVDAEQGDVEPLQEGQHARLHQALGRQVEHLDLAAADALGDQPLLVVAQRRIQRHRGHAEFVEGRDLVVHQGDQRRNDHRQTVAQQRRHLVAERFAAARGHQHQGVATLRHALDYRRLIAAEGVVAENVFEDAQGLVEHAGLRRKARIISANKRHTGRRAHGG